MKAIGMIDWTKSTKDDKKIVALFINESGKALQAGWAEYTLTNMQKIPCFHPDIGLFKYNKKNHTCQWIDPNKS
jgi:hypothetical protein